MRENVFREHRGDLSSELWEEEQALTQLPKPSVLPPSNNQVEISKLHESKGITQISVSEVVLQPLPSLYAPNLLPHENNILSEIHMLIEKHVSVENLETIIQKISEPTSIDYTDKTLSSTYFSNKDIELLKSTPLPEQRIEFEDPKEMKKILEPISVPDNTQKLSTLHSRQEDKDIERPKSTPLPEQLVEFEDPKEMKKILEPISVPDNTQKLSTLHSRQEDKDIERPKSMSLPEQLVKVIEQKEIEGVLESSFGDIFTNVYMKVTTGLLAIGAVITVFFCYKKGSTPAIQTEEASGADEKQTSNVLGDEGAHVETVIERHTDTNVKQVVDAISRGGGKGAFVTPENQANFGLLGTKQHDPYFSGQSIPGVTWETVTSTVISGEDDGFYDILDD